ncbi:lipocalin-like domain-containing protein [Sinorhizobium meliloti]|uniref:lipocalin-like domain-containing protein n=1 Tax=Rhizobium meliloti TaxID=382 RepID=UPI001F2D1A6B|nr:lipocalin-like domain-containing protein [Sinorhizobium meliloti]
MTSLQVTDASGKQTEIPYSGQVIFSQGGTLSVQAMNPDAAAEPTPYTANGYEAYYGPVEVDETKKTFAITVESSLVRNLIGQRMERTFEVDADQLTITPADPKEGWRVTYERL